MSAGLLTQAGQGIWTRVAPKRPRGDFLVVEPKITPGVITALDFGAAADRYSVGAIVLAFVFFLTVAIGAVLAKGVLTLMLSLMVGQIQAMASIRAVAAGLIALVR